MLAIFEAVLPVAAAITLAALAAESRAQQATVNRGLLLDGVTIVNTRDGKLSPDMEVVLDGAKIVRIVRVGTVKASGSARLIDEHGKFIVPGYLDMHVHVLDSPTRDGDLALMLANGITGFRQMSGSAALLEARKGGKLVLPVEAPELLAMPGEILSRANAATPEAAVAEVQRQKTEGADFIKTVEVNPPTFFAALTEAKRQGLPYAGHVSPGVDAAEASRQGMRSIEHLGPIEALAVSCSTAEPMIRQAMAKATPPPMPNLPPETMAKMMRTTLASPVLGHVIANPNALQKTQRLIDTYNEGKCNTLAKLFVTDQTWQVPTLIRAKTSQFADDPLYTGDPNLRYVSASTLQFWNGVGHTFTAKITPEDRETLKGMFALQLKLTKLFNESGVEMMTGTDFGGIWVVPGFSLHQEFDLLAQAGVAPLRILQMTTLNGAKFLGREGTAGSVDAGKDADLVLLDADPTADVQNHHRIAGVVRGGTYYSKNALESLKKKVADGVATESAASPQKPTP